MKHSPETRTLKLDDGRTVENVKVCRTFFHRLRGLMFRFNLKPGEAAFFPECRAIHTIGMFSDLNVIFLDSEMRTVKEVRRLKPFRVAFSLKARHVLEITES